MCFSENHANPDSGSSSDTEFVPRYDRIAGSRDNFSVFTSNLPGAQNVVTRSTSDEKAPSAMVRTTLPPQRESVGTVLPRAPQLVVTNLNEVSWGWGWESGQGGWRDYGFVEWALYTLMYLCVCVCAWVFCYMQRLWGKGWFTACSFFFSLSCFFFLVEISLYSSIWYSFIVQGSVHSGSVNWVDCGWVLRLVLQWWAQCLLFQMKWEPGSSVCIVQILRQGEKHCSDTIVFLLQVLVRLGVCHTCLQGWAGILGLPPIDAAILYAQICCA